jgi:hypothetical protein
MKASSICFFVAAALAAAAGCGTDPGKTPRRHSAAGGRPSQPLIGGRPISGADRALMETCAVGPMAALGDVDGDERLTAADRAAAEIARSGGEVPCARAADADVDGRITDNDLRFIGEVAEFNELHLSASAHLDCRAYARVASRSVGEPGGEVPLLLLADLREGAEHNTFVRVRSGPAKVGRSLESPQLFLVRIDEAARGGDEIEVAVDTGFERYAPEASSASGARRSAGGRSYVVSIAVTGDAP